MFETALDDPNGGFIDLRAPHPAIGFASATQEKQSLQDLRRHRDQKGALTSLLTKVFIVAKSSVTILVLLKSRNLAVQQLKSGDGQLLLTVRSKVGELPL